MHKSMDGCYLISVTCHKPGNSRKIAVEEVEHATGEGDGKLDADEGWLRFRKALLDAPELAGIDTAFRHLKLWLKDNSPPKAGRVMFRPGCFPLKKELLPEANVRYDEARAKLAEAADKVVEVYELRKAEAKAKLRDLYDEADYPTAGQFKAGCNLRMQVLEIGVPDDLPEGLKEEQKAQLDADWEEARQEVRLALRAGMLGLVKQATEKLAPSNDGDKKVIKSNSFGQLEKFLASFESRDITDDADTRALVKQARELLKGLDIQVAKDDDEYRAQIASQFQGVASQLDGLVTEQRGRMIEL